MIQNANCGAKVKNKSLFSFEINKERWLFPAFSVGLNIDLYKLWKKKRHTFGVSCYINLKTNV